MLPYPSAFEQGDSAAVKAGTLDEDSGIDLGGWQGRILAIEDRADGTFLMLSWDSITLKNIPESYLQESEEQGLDWSEYSLAAADVEPAKERDTAREAARVKSDIATAVSWCGLGAEGQRIRQVIAGLDGELEILTAWESHLRQKLKFPFAAEISEPQDRGRLRQGYRVTVLRISGVDDQFGIVVEIALGRERFDFPLCDLRTVGRKSPHKQALSDYAVWFANQ